MSRILFDDAYFNLGNSGIARVWRSFFEAAVEGNMFSKFDIEPVILNRSDKLTDLGLPTLMFPEYDVTHPAEDRRQLTRVAESLDISLVVSSYYTFSTSTPSLLLVYDLIPELLGFDESNRGWLERKLAFLQADAFAAISNHTKQRLHEFYPHTRKREVAVAYPAVDPSVFYPRPTSQIEVLRERLKLGQDYFVTVGSRYQTGGYKNGHLILAAMQRGGFDSADWLVVGGEPFTEEERQAAEQTGVNLVRVALSDDDVAVALTGSIALLYPSMEEGFGIPPLEALACGTPVVCTRRASLPEVVGDLGLMIGGKDPDELLAAMRMARSRELRSRVEQLGPKHAGRFRWQRFAETLLEIATREAKEPQTAASRFRSALIASNDDLVRGIQC